MDPREALAVLGGLEKFGMRFRLDAMEHMLRALGNPERELRAIHVGGTNGKGSVCAFLTSALIEAGQRVGTYTSPHLVAFEERIALDGAPIAPATMAALVEEVVPALEVARKAGHEPTYFEAATAMALQHFASQKVDVAVVEVGLGGRLDATNVFEAPLCSVVTNVSLDHTDVLGPTVEQIAWDKAHILRAGRPGVTAADGAALEVLRGVAAERGCSLGTLDRVTWARRAANLDAQVFELRTPALDYDAVRTRLLGDHQMVNAALAARALEECAAEGVLVSPAQFRAGAAAARWPGRLHVVARRPDVILDGAHNPSAVEALARFVAQGPWEEVHLVVGVLADKDHAAMAARLGPLAARVVCTEPPSPRRLPADQLAAELRRHARRVEVEPSPAAALDRAVRGAPSHALVLATGSLYLVGALLAARVVRAPGA
ncbi:MAG TPA: folylpolyglutamate synthase/dihydrofolate synthase family protein [Candidatus Thermoplasmatota archaeon]|nr:folylpolyglutamate synthase/dihydrofolate synthase family protein [Candidatus Thermoplasmatota archaeon]